jgi:hypothetical protein
LHRFLDREAVVFRAVGILDHAIGAGISIAAIAHEHPLIVALIRMAELQRLTVLKVLRVGWRPNEQESCEAAS